MSKIETFASRRDVLKGCVAVSAASLVGWNTAARAQDGEQLDPADPTAQALQYTHETPDASKPCMDCQLYTGEEGAEWGPCGIFPGKVVAANGWCVSWVAKS